MVAPLREPNFWQPVPVLTFADVDSLRDIEHPETVRVEFKSVRVFESRSRGRAFQEEFSVDFCTVANAGTGRFVFGAERDVADRTVQSFRGLPETEIRRTLNRIRAAAHAVDPPVGVVLKPIAIPERYPTEFIIVAEVSGSESGPHQVGGTYHLRIGSERGAMSHTMVVDRLRSRQATQADYLHGEDFRYPDPLEGNPWNDPKLGVFLGVWLRPPVPLDTEILDRADSIAVAAIEDVLRQAGVEPEPSRFALSFARDHRIGKVNVFGNASFMHALVDEETSTPSEYDLSRIEVLTRGMISMLAAALAAVVPTLRRAVRARLWMKQDHGLVLNRGAGAATERRRLKVFPVFVGGEDLGQALAGDLAASGETTIGMAKRFASLLFTYGERTGST